MKSKILPFLVLSLLCLSAAAIIRDSSHSKSELAVTPSASGQSLVPQPHGKLPLAFEANQGQTDAQVKFISRGSGYTLYLTSDEAVLTLRAGDQKAKGRGQKAKATERTLPEVHGPLALGPDFGLPAGNLGPLSIHNLQSSIGNSRASSAESVVPSREPRIATPESRTDAVLRMKLVGANPAAEVVGAESLPGKSNYFIGSDPNNWRTNVANYAKVEYKGVYPGIDLVYYGNQGQLEHDFVVAPGADPTAINLAIEGADSLRLDEQGNLVAQLDAGNVVLNKPALYQLGNPKSEIENPKSVDGRFVLLAGDRVGFEVSKYDRSQPLVIDPVLSYSTYLGGTIADSGKGIAVDSAGSVYVTGWTDSTDFPVTAGTLQTSCASNCDSQDAFVTKLSADGSTLIYSTYLGGRYTDMGMGIAVDVSGDAFVTGMASSDDFPVVNAIQPARNGTSQDAFVAKLNSTGDALLFSTYLGGSYIDVGEAIALDASANAYLTGDTNSPDFPVTAGVLKGTCGGNSDAFVTKVSSDGSALVYSTCFGGSLYEFGLGIAVDGSGNAYITGSTESSDFPLLNPIQDARSGWRDAFVAKLNATGTSLLYSTLLGGSDDAYSGGGISESGYGIAVDSAGSAYVTGLTSSSDFPTVNAMQMSFGGGSSDAFVSKLSPAGAALTYSTFLGGSSDESGGGITSDLFGSAYVTGFTASPDFPVLYPMQASLNTQDPMGSKDAFVAKLNSAGTALIYSTYFGGSRLENNYGPEDGAIAVDAKGNAYITGLTESQDFPAYRSFRTDLMGARNGFLSKLCSATPNQRAVDFSQQTLSIPSLARNVALTNLGGTPLAMTSITTSGEFDQSNTCNGSLGSGEACTISVTFTPVVEGTRLGELTLSDDACGNPYTIPLSGLGVLPALNLASTEIAFGTQMVGTHSVARVVNLSNTGQGVLKIASIAVSGDFAETDSCGGSVNPGSNCSLNVTFSPADPSERQGSLSISSNAPGSPHTVALSGNGTDFSMAAAADSATTAVIDAGKTAHYRLLVAPEGGFVGAVSLKVCCERDLMDTDINPSNVTVNGIDPASFTVDVITYARDYDSTRLIGPPPAWPRGLVAVLALMALVTCAGVAGVAKRRSRWALAAALLILLSSAACGGGMFYNTMDYGTTPGTYSLTVTATSGGVSHTLPLILEVR